jgi:hypothetical protein
MDWRALVTPMRRGAGSFYYPIVFGLSTLAFGVLLWRVRHETGSERRAALIFTIGLVAGSLPLVLQSMLDAIPSYNAFIHQQPVVELLVGVLLFLALASVPFVTAYSVLFDRVVELKVVLRAAIQYVLARYTIIALTAIPFAAIALMVLRHRSESLVTLLSGTRPIVLGAMGVAGVVALKLRERCLAALDRRYFREQYDARQIVDGLVNRALSARDAATLESLVCQAIEHGLHARASLFVLSESLGVLERPSGGEHVSVSAIALALAAADPVPMDVSPSIPSSVFSRLPPGEREWVVRSNIQLLLALCASDRKVIGLLAVSSKKSEQPYSVQDRRLITAIGASVSLALDNVRLRSTPDPTSEPAAQECRRCSRLNPSDAPSCSCGGPVVPAAAPQMLRGVFRIDKRIGAGGMGVVYYARDLSLGRAVAIKTLPRVTPKSAAQLRREARAMAAVTHPNLAMIFGIETWRGVPFLVEEFLAGGTLSARLASGPMPVAEALELGATLAGALDYLHETGLIHRDIKPSNIGFTAARVTKLLDFGLARLSEQVDNDPSAVTTTLTAPSESVTQWSAEGGFVGTPLYMSPEALRGEMPHPSFDLWSLSIVLYETLTCARPFTGKDAAHMLLSVSTGAPAPPSALGVRCPPQVDAYFANALHLDATRRPADAASMRSELVRLRQLCE